MQTIYNKNGKILYTSNQTSQKAAIEKAVREGIDLQSAHINFSIRDAKLQKAKLRRATFCGQDLTNVNLDEADLTNADLSEAVLHHASLQASKLDKANFSNAHLYNTQFVGSSCKRTVFDNTYLNDVHMNECDLTYASFKGCHIGSIYLWLSNLYGADLTPFKHQFWLMLLENPDKVEIIRNALTEGNYNLLYEFRNVEVIMFFVIYIGDCLENCIPTIDYKDNNKTVNYRHLSGSTNTRNKSHSE